MAVPTSGKGPHFLTTGLFLSQAAMATMSLSGWVSASGSPASPFQGPTWAPVIIQTHSYLETLNLITPAESVFHKAEGSQGIFKGPVFCLPRRWQCCPCKGKAHCCYQDLASWRRPPRGSRWSPHRKKQPSSLWLPGCRRNLKTVYLAGNETFRTESSSRSCPSPARLHPLLPGRALPGSASVWPELKGKWERMGGGGRLPPDPAPHRAQVSSCLFGTHPLSLSW